MHYADRKDFRPVLVGDRTTELSPLRILSPAHSFFKPCIFSTLKELASNLSG